MMMTHDEFYRYWKPLRDRIKRKLAEESGPPYGQDFTLEASTQIASWFGYPYPRGIHWEWIPLSEEMKQQLISLNCDNWFFLGKVLKARKETDENRKNLPETGEVDSSKERGT